MKLLKNSLSMSTLVGTLVVSMIFISPVRAVADIDILSHTGYLDPFGCYHVVGEVKNVGDQAVSFVTIEVTFYNSNDVVVDTIFDSAMLTVLLVDRKSPFDIVLLDATQSAKVDHYTLTMTFSATSPIPVGLKILTHSAYVDEIGWMHIVGEIKNIATEKAHDVKVIATYYDETGDVVAATLTYLHPEPPSDTDPGQTEPFEILLSDEDRTPYIDTYELTAESSGDNKYACTIDEQAILPTDLNKDGTVNILDIAIVASAFGSRPGDSGWNPDADLDGNEIINIIDISAVAIDFGKTV